MLALIGESVAGPGLEDKVERFLKALAALLLRDRVAFIMQWRGAAATTELEPPVAEDVGNRRFLGDLYRVVQGQQSHRGSQANAGRALRRRCQHHQRVGEDREGSAEMELAEPYRVKAKLIAELDLRHDVPVALTLGETARARQLIEKPEAHESSVPRTARKGSRRS